MDRSDLQRLSRLRLKEAKVLLDAGLYEGSYYLAGYAVECALKACIAKQTRRYDFPDKQAVNNSYTHKLGDLLKTAGLELEFNRQASRDVDFRLNWNVAKDWNEERRYEYPTQKQAEDLYTAITQRQHGVLRWLRKHW